MERLFKAKTCDEFLVRAFEHYNIKLGMFSESVADSTLIYWLYNLGLSYNLINVDYNQFIAIMTNRHKNYFRGYYRPRKKYCGIRSHFCDPKWYRTSRKFIYNGQPKKNHPTINPWREVKGFNKDKRKIHSTSVKKNFKHYCKRKHRMLEKIALKNEKYEKLHRLSYKQAEDIWSWD